MNTFILDLETTGLSSQRDQIIEIGIKLFNVDKSFSTLVKPVKHSGKYVCDRIVEITGITNEMIESDGISSQSACEQLFNFIFENSSKDEESVFLLAHNGKNFDFVFIQRLFRAYTEYAITHGINIMNMIKLYERFKYIDTLHLARFVLPNNRSHSQKNLAIHYKLVQEDAHRALSDVLDLEYIYKCLVTEYINRKGLDISLLFNTQYIFDLY
jgi:DNA polymerase III subunit alpha, Gram-positive type